MPRFDITTVEHLVSFADSLTDDPIFRPARIDVRRDEVGKTWIHAAGVDRGDEMSDFCGPFTMPAAEHLAAAYRSKIRRRRVERAVGAHR